MSMSVFSCTVSEHTTYLTKFGGPLGQVCKAEPMNMVEMKRGWLSELVELLGDLSYQEDLRSSISTESIAQQLSRAL